MPNKDDPSDVEARAVAAELCACSVFGCAFDEDPVPGSEKWGLLHSRSSLQVLPAGFVREELTSALSFPTWQVCDPPQEVLLPSRMPVRDWEG